MKTFGALHCDREKKAWVIDSLEPHVAIKLKALFTKIPRYRTAPFDFADRPDVCQDLEWFIQRYPISMSEEDREYLASRVAFQVKRNAELERIMAPDYQPTLFKIKGELRQYQAQAVDLYLKNQMLLIGDDVGLGKTLDAIGSFMEPSTLPAAVVVQTHLPAQWVEKICEFTDLRVHIIRSRKAYSLPPADVYIFKYSNLSGWVDVFGMKIFKSVVFDEMQELRIEGSQKYCSAQQLVANVDYALGLTATPIYNYGDEIFNIIDLLKPGCLGERVDFMREWGGYGRAITDPKSLGTFLRENHFFLRRTRSDVGRELPPVNKIVETVETDTDTIKGIESLARQLAIKTTSGTFVERGQAARDLDMMVRHATGVAKAKSIATFVRVLLENNEPVLLAGWHRDVYDIWLEELKDFKPVMYTGTESPAEKERTKSAFINGDTNLMIISLRSGIGIDGLQKRCSLLVIGELDWSPMVHEQLIGRLNRDGQEQQVTVFYLISDQGSDLPIVDLLGIKASQSQEIMDPLKTATAQHTDLSRIQLLAQQYLKKIGEGTHAEPMAEAPSLVEDPATLELEF